MRTVPGPVPWDSSQQRKSWHTERQNGEMAEPKGGAGGVCSDGPFQSPREAGALCQTQSFGWSVGRENLRGGGNSGDRDRCDIRSRLGEWSVGQDHWRAGKASNFGVLWNDLGLSSKRYS